MTGKEATEMISFRDGSIKKDPENWIDLGCGAGTFTLALAGLLPAGSSITAVDRDASALRQIPAVSGDVAISKIEAEMTGFISGLQQADGIIMANALHFIKEQESFLFLLKRSLKPGGMFLLVEYDLQQGSRWVPFPLTPLRAKVLLAGCGFDRFRLLKRRPSRYGPQELYSAVTYA